MKKSSGKVSSTFVAQVRGRFSPPVGVFEKKIKEQKQISSATSFDRKKSFNRTKIEMWNKMS